MSSELKSQRLKNSVATIAARSKPDDLGSEFIESVFIPSHYGSNDWPLGDGAVLDGFSGFD